MKRYISEIESILDHLPRRTSAQHPESYIGGGQSKLRFIGLRVPDLRRTYKNGFSFSGKDPAKVAKIWHYIWANSDCFEVKSLALAWFEDPQQRPVLIKYWPLLKTWSTRIDNWAHSDTLSGIYARIHEVAPVVIYPTFLTWSQSENPWLRRISIVSLFYYSSQRQRYPSLSKIKSLLNPQLKFNHYYVQKGVGWTLREAGNVYPDPVYRYIESNILNISATAFSAATEKMTAQQRVHLKHLRKHKVKAT